MLSNFGSDFVSSNATWFCTNNTHTDTLSTYIPKEFLV
jgi:hypothetical protein